MTRTRIETYLSYVLRAMKEEPMTATPETRTAPTAWVGCLSCYNDGNLVGKWLTDPDEIRNYRCPEPVTVYGSHEELWVFDHEDLPFIKGECSPSEFADLAEKCAAALDEIGVDPDIVLAYIDNVGVDYIEWDTLTEDFAVSYAGEFEDLADYAYRLADESGGLPEGPYANYIDWEAVGRDDLLGGDIWTHDVGYKSMHIFRNNT